MVKILLTLLFFMVMALQGSAPAPKKAQMSAQQMQVPTSTNTAPTGCNAAKGSMTSCQNFGANLGTTKPQQPETQEYSPPVRTQVAQAI